MNQRVYHTCSIRPESENVTIDLVTKLAVATAVNFLFRIEI